MRSRSRLIQYILCAWIAASPALAHLPVGGLDIFADHWFMDGGHSGPAPYGGPYDRFGGHGPFRGTLYALNLSGIDNNVESAQSSGFAGAGELYFSGPFSVGGSVGAGSSNSLKWTHASAQATSYLTPFFALHVGYIAEKYQYPTNLDLTTNLDRNELNGFTAGASLIGSPAPGFFFQLGAHAVPMESIRVDGTKKDSGYQYQVDGLIGLSVFGSFDLSVMARATSGLGDQSSTSVLGGLGASATF